MSQWTIGRAPDCDVIVEESGVSRYHARLKATGRGFVIEDCGSSGGTYLNGKKIHAAASIRAGDTIGLGKKHVLRTQSGLLAQILSRDDIDQGAAEPQHVPAPARPRATGGSKGPAMFFGFIVLVGIAVAVVMVTKKSGEADKKQDGSVSGSLNEDEIKLGTQSLGVGDKAFCTASSYAEKDGVLSLATNRHCIEGFLDGTGGFAPMEVEFVSKKKVQVDKFELERTGKDLARLYLKAESLKEGEDYALLPRLSKTTKLKEQQDVVTVGSSAGLKWTFSGGMISRLGCPLEETQRELNIDLPKDFKCIQIDAAISGGNSGGPLFLKEGEGYVWIGINTLGSVGRVQNLNFAIHVEEFFSRDYEPFPMTQQGLIDARKFMK